MKSIPSPKPSGSTPQKTAVSQPQAEDLVQLSQQLQALNKTIPMEEVLGYNSVNDLSLVLIRLLSHQFLVGGQAEELPRFLNRHIRWHQMLKTQPFLDDGGNPVRPFSAQWKLP